jgi:lipid A 3-O-deacylase
MEGRQSTLQLEFEPFVNSINGKNAGVETGCSLGVRYFYTISRSVDLFTEGSIAPMFLGIDTIEQRESGFNFLDQIGGGLQYKLFSKIALFAGYRFMHISNARFVNRPNEGINSNALIGGFSWLF